jgi:hypothetical protein
MAIAETMTNAAANRQAIAARAAAWFEGPFKVRMISMACQADGAEPQ